MKKLILLLPLFLFLQSCESDGSKDVFGDYTIRLNFDYDTYCRSGLGNYYSNCEFKIYISEYDSNNERVAAHLWEDVKYKEAKTFTANKRAVKLVVRYETTVYATNGRSVEEGAYLANVFYLDEYDYIEITEKTITSSLNPIE